VPRAISRPRAEPQRSRSVVSLMEQCPAGARSQLSADAAPSASSQLLAS